MDNYFNIYRPHLRLTEQTDTRAAIQQHQKQQERRRGEGAPHEKDARMFDDDVMEVSILALIGLLEDLIHQGQRAQKPQNEDENKDGDDDGDQGKEVSDDRADEGDETFAEPTLRNTNAAMAYQHAAQTVGTDYRPPKAKEPKTKPSEHNAAGIPPDKIDVVRIAKLLDKAKKLQASGVEEVSFRDKGDFLVMLERTVDDYLQP